MRAQQYNAFAMQCNAFAISQWPCFSTLPPYIVIHGRKL